MRSKLGWSEDGFSCSTGGWPVWMYWLLRLTGKDPLQTRRPKTSAKVVTVGLSYRSGGPFLSESVRVNGTPIEDVEIHKAICLMLGVKHERSLVYLGQPAFYTSDDRYAKDIIINTWNRKNEISDYDGDYLWVKYNQKLEYLKGELT